MANRSFPGKTMRRLKRYSAGLLDITSNLLANSRFAGGTAAPTSWTQPVPTGASVSGSVVADGNIIYRHTTAAQRSVFNQNVVLGGGVAPGDVFSLSLYVHEFFSGAIFVDHLVGFVSTPAGSTVIYKIDDVVVPANTLITANKRVACVLTAGAVAGGVNARVGAGVIANITVDLNISRPMLNRGGVTAPYLATGPLPAVPTGFMTKVGTNLSGMEWSAPSLRYGTSTLPNFNFTVPRVADVQNLAAIGYGKVRLPIQWELLQPVLASSNPNTATRALIGEPGAFNAKYQAYVTSVLDACAAAGTKCLIDLHNYCRYQDFVFEADGSVTGLTVPSDPLIAPFTTNNAKVRLRLMALAAGATLTQSDFNDFWTRAATLWKNHAGFGGYGLMNEPRQMPMAGGIVPYDSPWVSGNVQDLTIWPTFAISAYNAIRAVDSVGMVYVSGNNWQNVMGFPNENPGYPIPGATNVIYDVHMYLDATSGGFRFDWDYEVGLGYSAGLNGPINEMTGRDRLALGVVWAESRVPPVKLALTEIGMPIDDVRWQNSFKNAVDYAKLHDVEIYTWMGGNHAYIHSYPINDVPQWHQNKTMNPLVSGVLRQVGLVNAYAVFDDGDSYGVAGTPYTVTVYIRGNLIAPLTIMLFSSGAGTLNKTEVVIPAGANGKDTYTYTPAANEVALISYTAAGGGQAPPTRSFYSFTDPVAYAATSLSYAALTLMAKYKVAKWIAADAYTDYLTGSVPSGVNAVARAISDSGFGSTPGNPMEMICWHNDTLAALGYRSIPKVQESGGVRYLDLTAYGTLGLWSKKRMPVPNDEPNPTNKVLFNLEDAHFAIATMRVASAGLNGIAFQASHIENGYFGDISLQAGVPQAQWRDSAAQTITRAGPALALNTVHTLTMQSTATDKALRINGAVAATGAGVLAASKTNQMLIGCGYLDYYPRDGFQGHLFGVAAGKGTPTASELGVMESYMASLAGASIALPVAPPTMPVPLNNQVAFVGDSRTAINTIDANVVPMLLQTAYGYASWADAVSGYRAKFIGNYGVNASTLDTITTRLTSVETRGQILASPASVFVFFAGVNNSGEVIGTMGPKYQSIINQLTASGKICIVFNEIPNNDINGTGAVHLGRRSYLDGAVYTNDARVIRFNSYDIMALNPSSVMGKAGYYGDTLHPAMKGHRAMGVALGAILNQLFAASPTRNTLATVKAARAPMFNGTTGNIGSGATGVMAGDWDAEGVPAGLTVVYSKGSDPDGYEQQIITVSGTPTGTAYTYAQWSLNDYSVAGSGFVSGDSLMHGYRCVINAGNTGLVTVVPTLAVNDNTNAVFLRSEAFSINIYDNGGTTNAPWLGGTMDGAAFDYVVKTPPIVTGAGWTASASKSVTPRISLTFRVGEVANAVIKLSRSTIFVNT